MNIFKSLLSVFNKSSRNHQSDRQAKRNQQINRDDRSNVLFYFTLFIITIAIVVCCKVIVDPLSNPDVVKLAFTFLTVIVSSLVSFVTGKAIA